MESILFYMIAALGISVIVNLIFKRFGISQIIGYILTGTVVVYAFDLRHMTDSHTLELIGEFGIVFLMFTIGLEMSLAKLRLMKKLVFINGSLQVGISAVIFFIASYHLFGIDLNSSLIIAAALSLSSTAVVLTYLKESKGIYAPYGQRSTGILIFQDIAVIPILIMIGFLASDGDDLKLVLLETAVSAIVVIGLLFVIGKKVMAWLLHFSADSKVEELFMGSVLVIVVGASLLAHAAGFTYSLGAFVAGMIIAETRYLHKVEADIAPFKDLLLGVFFVTVGMKIDLAFFFTHIFEIFGLFAAILFIKGAVIHGIIGMGSKSVTGFKTAVTLAQVGEFSFAIFALAAANQLMDPDLVQMLVLVVVLSMIATPFMLAKRRWLQDILFKEGEIEQRDMSPLEKRKNHVVVCGYGIVGQFVAKQLQERGIPHVVVDNNYRNVQRAKKAGEEIYYGDMSKPAILHALHVEDAASVIITLDNADKKLQISEALVQYSDRINIVVKVVNSQERAMLQDLPITYMVDGKEVVAEELVEKTMLCNLSR
ncbi:MAG: cation:proton antiporter [Sulfurimonadaceae bacterium]|nr:cation:proton antiporter [Sulfurimonadaceae bacterium]